MQENTEKAYEMFDKGIKPGYSTSICGSVTAGYGKLDFYGYWEFPLKVDQDTIEIVQNKTKGD